MLFGTWSLHATREQSQRTFSASSYSFQKASITSTPTRYGMTQE
jgi:hypothetical protein